MATLAYNIKTDGTVHAKGDGRMITATLTTSTTGGVTTLSAVENLSFTNTATDAGKLIAFELQNNLPGFDVLDRHATSIATVVNDRTVTLTDVYSGTPLAGLVRRVEYGTDDLPAFVAFNTAALAWQNTPNVGLITLTVPAGRYILYSGAINFPFANGIRQLVVQGADRTTTFLSDNMRGNFTLGNIASVFAFVDIPSGNFPGARTNTATAGSTSVTLKNVSEASWSRFVSGAMVLMCGYDLQQGSGAPPNAQYFDWLRIDTVNTATGVITFTTPLSYTYLDSWPCFNPGKPGGGDSADCGGPAALFPTLDGWDIDLTYNDICLDAWYQQTSINARKITQHNFNALGPQANFFSQQQSHTISGTCDWLAIGVEVDKLVGSITADGLNVHSLDFTSPGTHLMTASNSHIVSIHGTPENLVMSNCHVDNFVPGTHGWGGSSSINMTNTQIDAFVFNPHRNSNGYVATGGIVTTAKWSGMPSWGYPGAKLFIAAARDNDGYPFQCMSVTHDGDVKVTHLTTTSGQTLLTSSDPIFTTDKITVGMPISNDYNDGSTLRSTIASRVDDFNIHTTDNATHSMTNAANLNVTWGSVYCHLDVDHLPTNFGGATRYVVVHPCPMWHGSGNTGCNWILELNNAAAQGKPIFSYVSRLYTGGGGYHFDYTDPDLPEVWGSPVQVTITTTVAGSGDFYAMEFDPGIPLVVQDDSNTVVPYKPIVNTAHAGARVIAPNVTPTGAQTGDSGLAISATNLWMSGGSRPYDATSAGSTVTVEVITNQGYDFGRTFTITFT